MKKTFATVLAVTLGLALAGLASAARNSSGTYSRPVGNPVTTSTPIASAWANALTGDLATEITDSLSRSGKGGMLAPLRTLDGSATLPAWSFTNETGTGLYRIGLNDVGLSIGGTKKIEFTSGLDTFTDAVSFLGSTTTAGRARFPGGIYGDVSFASSVTVSGFATFASSVTVPTPQAATDATNKAYVDASAPSSTSFVASSSCGGFTTGSTTAVDITNLSVSITTHGRPVMVTMQAVGNNLACQVKVTTTGGGGGGYGTVNFVRGVTTVSEYDFGSSAVSTTFTYPGSLSYVDRPAAGTYTYKAQAQVVAGTPSLEVITCVLAAFEL